MIMETLEHRILEKYVREILEVIGENSKRKGLTDTAIIMYESREEIGSVLDAYEIIWDLAVEVDGVDWKSYVNDLVEGMNEASEEQLKIERNKLEEKVGQLSNPFRRI